MSRIADITRDTIDRVAKLNARVRDESRLAKAVDAATGVTGYNLKETFDDLTVILSPFAQSIVRVEKPGSGTNWKKLTAVTRSGSFFTTESAAANTFTLTTSSDSATYVEAGRRGSTTWKAAKQAGNFGQSAKDVDQAKLQALYLQDWEGAVLGGNITALNSGSGPTPVVTAAASGGSLADATYYVSIAALTWEGYVTASAIKRPTSGNSYDFSGTAPTVSSTVGTTAGGTEDSDAVSGGSGAGKITVTFTGLAGAYAYAVYIGTSTGAANTKLQGIVTQNELVVTDTNTTGAARPSSDSSANANAFDGILPQLVVSGSGATVDYVNAPLSAASGHSIAELDSVIDDIWDRTKHPVSRIVMSWVEAASISNKLSSVTATPFAINIGSGGETDVHIPDFTSYKDARGHSIPIEVSPNIPGGLLLFLVDDVKYPGSNIGAAWQWAYAAEEMLEYAMTSSGGPKEEYEIRTLGALEGHAPALQGVAYCVHEY